MSSSSLSAWFSVSISLLNSGKQTITEARRPVPKLEGHVPKNPNFSFHMSLAPLVSADILIKPKQCVREGQIMKSKIVRKYGTNWKLRLQRGI